MTHFCFSQTSNIVCGGGSKGGARGNYTDFEFLFNPPLVEELSWAAGWKWWWGCARPPQPRPRPSRAGAVPVAPAEWHSATKTSPQPPHPPPTPSLLPATTHSSQEPRSDIMSDHSVDGRTRSSNKLSHSQDTQYVVPWTEESPNIISVEDEITRFRLILPS